MSKYKFKAIHQDGFFFGKYFNLSLDIVIETFKNNSKIGV